uniref:Ig-like domain-containing protein n=1 Tax=Poecilia formosa TaxID=48698 RepID=A0A096LUC2_POEFO
DLLETMRVFLCLTIKTKAKECFNINKFTVRVGDEVTLPCKDVTDGQNKCDGTTWSFIRSASVTLFEAGNINLTIPDRLNVTVNCSLVIKKVSMEDVGRYTCRQLTSGQEGPNSSVYLSVVHSSPVTEQKINDSVVLNCSVVDYEIPRHTVEWLYEGKTSSDSKTSPPVYRSTVILTTSLHQNSTSLSSIKCNVTNISTKEVQLFTFSHQSTDQDTDQNTGHKADQNTG